MGQRKPEPKPDEQENKPVPATNPEQDGAKGDATGEQNKPAPEGGDKGGVKFTPEQQKLIDELIGTARKEGRSSASRELEDKQKKDSEVAEQKRLEEQKEWEKLANDRKASVEKLEADNKTLTETNERYATAIKSKLESERKGLPEHIVALLDKLDPVDQLEWLAANGETARKGTAPAGPGTPARSNKPSEQPIPVPGNQAQKKIGVRI